MIYVKLVSGGERIHIFQYMEGDTSEELFVYLVYAIIQAIQLNSHFYAFQCHFFIFRQSFQPTIQVYLRSNKLKYQMGDCLSGNAKVASTQIARTTKEQLFRTSKSVLSALQLGKDANAIDSLLGFGLAKSFLPLESQWTNIYQQQFAILKDLYYHGLVGIQPCVFILISAIEEKNHKKVENEEQRHKHFVHVFSESVKGILEENEYFMAKWRALQRVECEICCLKGAVAEMGVLNCRHMFHPECIASYLQSKIETNQVELECPMDGCRHFLDNQEIYSYIDSQLKKKYETFCFNKFVQQNAESVSWCPTAGCTAVFQFDRAITEYNCPVCLKQYCLRCRCQFHSGLTCEEYKKEVSDRKIDDAFVVFAKGAKFKQCPKCNFWVERITGCNSMNCKCGQNFCYNCGGTGCEHFKCKRA